MQSQICACAALAGLLFAGPAVAETTVVYPPYFTTEPDHETILESIYGLDFSDAGPGFQSAGWTGLVTANRLDDHLAMSDILNVVTGRPGSVDDQVWGYGDITATAVARYAGYSQQFGYDAGDGFQVLFDVSGSGTNVTGSASIDLSEQTWVWGRRDVDGTNPYYSEIEQNRDALDHLVTYRIDGLDADATVWLLFWEDMPGGYAPPLGSDRDFNDLVVEIRATPEPGTLALLALGSAALLRRRRQK